LIGTGLYVIGSTASLIGTATIGSAARLKLYSPLPMTASGRSLVMKYTYIGDERMKVFSYTPVVVPEPEPRQMGN
jgi:hypothetical protein